MRICELFEARRNPQQNIKKSSIRDEALGYLSELDNVSYYGVTFTSTLKLGINPKTGMDVGKLGSGFRIPGFGWFGG